ncbi:leucine-rich repeat-containing protein 47-like [Macrobrachium nipponense]|uniref:leucine-rich repeat-containing protein 47-like n=1 Tax=Macrobrachium nipponense TaxID=159736 RepID=UPI0030C7B695
MWPEVKQAKEENRYELVLSGTEVSERIEEEGGVDPSVYELSQLNFLRISKSPLTTIKDDVGLLANLTSLILQLNKLEKLPVTVGNLTKLKVLDVSFNSLEDLPSEINKLSNLSTLNLGSNKIRALPSLEGCISLAILEVGHNLLTEFPDICKESLVHLADVKLNDNQISEVSPDLTVLPSLKILDLGNNQLKTVPGELADCVKLKDINLKGNPLSDRHFKKVVEAERCTPKQVLGNIKQHCPRVNVSEGGKGGDGGKGKKGKRGKGKGKDDDQMDEMCNEIHVLTIKDTGPVVQVSSEVKDVRPYVVCCVIQGVDLSGENLKKFISAQTKLHDGICDKRMMATIATHDLNKIQSPLKYVVRKPEEIRIHPLVRGKEVSALELHKSLQQEAEAQRKQMKRNNVPGLHKFLHLVEEWDVWPCLVNSDGVVISLPPITNSENTKITQETTDVFVEVTSGTSLNKAKAVLDALIMSSLNSGIGSEKTPAGKSSMKIQQVRVEDEEGNLRVVYPSRTDLVFENEAVRIINADK